MELRLRDLPEMDKGVRQLPNPLFWHALCAPDHKPRAHEISESDEVRSLIELRNERFEGISEPIRRNP